MGLITPSEYNLHGGLAVENQLLAYSISIPLQEAIDWIFLALLALFVVIAKVHGKRFDLWLCRLFIF